jgi:hypothetical protein
VTYIRGYYALAFLLAVFSGLFFGFGPIRQILRSDPGRSFTPDPQAPAADAALHCATFCWVYRSPFALSWSPLRLSPCAAWLVRLPQPRLWNAMAPCRYSLSSARSRGCGDPSSPAPQSRHVAPHAIGEHQVWANPHRVPAAPLRLRARMRAS